MLRQALLVEDTRDSDLRGKGGKVRCLGDGEVYLTLTERRQLAASAAGASVSLPRFCSDVCFSIRRRCFLLLYFAAEP